MDRRMLLTMGMMMGGGGGSLLPFSDDFSAELPQWTGATWGVAAGVASNTPTLSSELVTNGDMETGDPPTGWSAGAGDVTLSSVADERTGGAGSAAMNINRGASSLGAFRSAGMVAGGWYQHYGWLRNVDASEIHFGGSPTSLFVSSTSWTERLFVARVSDAFVRLFVGGSSGQDVRADDISIKALTLASLFRSINAGTANVSAQVEVTRTEGTQAGLVMCLDDAATPANFVIVYLDGAGNVKVEKCVAGTYTPVSSNSVTYSAGAVLKCVKSGTGFTTTYNGNSVATDTISDAGIIGNKRHGLFSTYSANVFDDYLAEAA